MKKVLFPILALILAMVAAIAIPMAGAVSAPTTTEVLYLSNIKNNANDGTDILSVDLDYSTTPPQANLILVTTIPLDSSAAIAATADGEKIYCIDFSPYENGISAMGYYDVAADWWYPLGDVTYNGRDLRDIFQAAFSPIDGKLYVTTRASGQGADQDFCLYTVDTGTCVATKVGRLYDEANPAVVIKVAGADIAFTADGTLYMWNNGTTAPSQYGLWTLNLTAVDGKVYCTHVGSGPSDAFFTGMAVRANGYGDLVGCTSGDPPSQGPPTYPDYLYVISKADAHSEGQFEFYKDGNPYNNMYGDMTVGPLTVCTRTIGYWKNHDWNGAVITICGETVDEELGDTILWNAKGKDFSMFFAQLIAAKLNTDNTTGIAVIDEAEAWLCSQSVDWNSEFASKSQKRIAAGYWEALDDFNNEFECE